MMFSNKFVISVLVDGQVQKELTNGECQIPFGEYSIRFRNKNNRRAVAKLFIDGERMCKGGFVIPANDYRDIDCSSQTLRKFKFVELQSVEAQDHGKDQVNAEKKMGLIEVQFHLEKETPQPVVKEIHHHYINPYPITYGKVGSSYHDMYSHDVLRPCSAFVPSEIKLNDIGIPSEINVSSSSTTDYDDMESVECSKSSPVKDGATVEGNLSNMRFGEIYFQYEETATILKLYLRGFDSIQEVNSVTEESLYCKNCGTKTKKPSNLEQAIEDLGRMSWTGVNVIGGNTDYWPIGDKTYEECKATCAILPMYDRIVKAAAKVKMEWRKASKQNKDMLFDDAMKSNFCHICGKKNK